MKNIDFIECFSLPCAQTQKYFCLKSAQTQKYFCLKSAQTQKYSEGFEAPRGLLLLFSRLLSAPKCDGGFLKRSPRHGVDGTCYKHVSLSAFSTMKPLSSLSNRQKKNVNPKKRKLLLQCPFVWPSRICKYRIRCWKQE